MKLGRLGRRFIAFGVAAMMVGACGAEPRAVRPPPSIPLRGLSFAVDYSTYTMRNGLVVVLAPDDESNLVTVDVRYYVGASDEIAGKTGLAHLAEHLTFEAAPEGAVRQTLTARLGEAALSYNAGTTLDRTHYYAIGLAPSLEPLLAIEALRLTSTCGQLSDELFARERAVVVQELAQRRESSDVTRSLYALLWGPAHPFAHGIGGDDVATLTRDDYCAFVAKHYVPANATLVIGGHIDPAKALKLVAKYFDKIPRGEPPAQVTLPGLAPAKALAASRVKGLAVDHPTAMVVFPLMPEGTPQRVQQRAVIALVGSEMARRTADSKDLVGSETFTIGSSRQSAVALMMSSKTATYEKLVEEIYASVAKALEIEPGPLIHRIQAMMITSLAAEHDNMLERGTLIGDHSQFTGDDKYASAADVITALTAEDLKKVGAQLFRRQEGRLFTFEKKRETGEALPELANAGEARVYDLPPRAQLNAAASAALPLHQLTAKIAPLDFKLNNGLRVILVPRRNEAFFEARFVLPIGDADDPDHRTGTAELTATLLDPPHEDLGMSAALMTFLGALGGGNLAAETTSHTTTFRVRGVPSLASVHLWQLHALLESGQLRAGGLDELRKLLAERELEEQAQAADPKVLAAARKQRLWRAVISKLLGKEHPMLRDRQGDLKQITIADLAAFRDAHYRSNGAVLVVVGGFDRAEIEREITELWGAWPNKEVPRSRSLPPAQPEVGQAYFALERPDSQVQLSLAFFARSDAERDAGAQLVAAELLHDRVGEIRQRLAATYGLEIDYQQLMGSSFVVVTGRVAPDRGAEVLVALREAWNPDRDGAGQLALEVARARRKALQQALAKSSSSEAIADSIAMLAITGSALGEQQKQISAIAAVTTDQVRAVMKGDLDPSRMVVAASGPGASAILHKAGAVQVEQVP